MKKLLIAKMNEALGSTIPIIVIVLLLCFTIAPLPVETLMLFILGAALLIVGMGFFSLGADIAMMPAGEAIGREMTRKKKVWFIILCCFVIGVIITIAEPDLQVLAKQVPAVPDMTLILTVAFGVGIFLVVAFLRVLLNVSLSKILLVCYVALFAFSFFVPGDFLAVAFDSGGVTTGPITVPFIMALGLGLTSIHGSGKEEDSFGLIALCSIGPILSVLLLGIVYHPSGSAQTDLIIPEINSSKELWEQFRNAVPTYVEEVAVAMLPILAFFLLFQFTMLKMRKKQVAKILAGTLYTFIGLTLFLVGANVGFIPVGKYLGSEIAGLDFSYILIPIGMLIGFFIVRAEPAVHVLNKQVEEVSSGAISQRAMGTSLAIGMAISVGLSMVRVLTGISIYWMLIPGYAIALALTFFVPRMFTAIAFDSGGVASGPMTATFLLAFAMGATETVGGNVLTDAFGVVAMVAMTPLITIQILGLIYRLKSGRMEKKPLPAANDNEMIDFTDFESEEG